jgi:hypothetical protein
MTIRERFDLAAAFVLARLQETSTWRSFVIIASAATWNQLDSGSKGEVVMQAGLLMSGLLGAILPDKLRK